MHATTWKLVEQGHALPGPSASRFSVRDDPWHLRHRARKSTGRAWPCSTIGPVLLLVSALYLSAAPTYKDVNSIFAARCYGCHAAAVKMGSLNLQTWDGFQEGGTHGKIVVPGKSAESRLYLLIS